MAKFQVTISLDDVVLSVDAADESEATYLARRMIEEEPSNVLDEAFVSIDPELVEGDDGSIPVISFSEAETGGIPMDISVGNEEFVHAYGGYFIRARVNPDTLPTDDVDKIFVYEIHGDGSPKEMFPCECEDSEPFLGSFLSASSFIPYNRNLTISPDGELHEGLFDYSFEGDDIFCGTISRKDA